MSLQRRVKQTGVQPVRWSGRENGERSMEWQKQIWSFVYPKNWTSTNRRNRWFHVV
jgi:hypothetical protein